MYLVCICEDFMNYVSTWSAWQWYPPELYSGSSVRCPSSAALCWLHRSAALPLFTERGTRRPSFCRRTRGSSSFLEHVCHVHPNNPRRTSRQSRLHIQGIFKPLKVQTAAEMCDLTLPWHLGRCCSPSFALALARMCEREQKVIWLETVAFCWAFCQVQLYHFISLLECCWRASLLLVLAFNFQSKLIHFLDK